MEHGRVGIVDLDPVEAAGFEELHDLHGGRKVVGYAAVVHADGTAICNRKRLVS